MANKNKTKRRSLKRASTYKSKKIEATFHGIHKWFTSLFEQLGWMVLAHKKGYNDKIVAYKHSLLRLKNAIETKIASVHELDRKDDLLIMHKNLLILMNHVHHDFH
jgi:hypothetical protein